MYEKFGWSKFTKWYDNGKLKISLKYNILKFLYYILLMYRLLFFIGLEGKIYSKD